jgi:hypothetical protein
MCNLDKGFCNGPLALTILPLQGGDIRGDLWATSALVSE